MDGHANSHARNRQRQNLGSGRKRRQADQSSHGSIFEECLWRLFTLLPLLILGGLIYMAFRLTKVEELNSEQIQGKRTQRTAFCDLESLPYICAHGGDSSMFLPNTAEAYAAAIAITNCIEIDVSLTADQQLVALHDNDVQQRLRKPSAKVWQYTLAELQMANALTPANSVLTITQALEMTAPHVPRVILDVKAGNDKELQLPDGTTQSKHAFIAEQLLAVVDALGYTNTLIWAKSDNFIKEVRLRALDQLCGCTVMRTSASANAYFMDPLRPSAEGVQVAAVYHGMLSDQLMYTLKAGNKSVYAWTVDDLAEVEQLLELGINGIVTNNPAEITHAINQRVLKCPAKAAR